MSYKTYEQVSAKIRQMIAGVPDSGEVMDVWGRQPSWAISEAAPAGGFWALRRASISEQWPNTAIRDFQGDETEETAIYEITFHYPYSIDTTPPSETKFNAIVDAVRAKFADDLNLEGYVFEAGLLQMDSGQTGFVIMETANGTLCHYARFTLAVKQFRPRGD